MEKERQGAVERQEGVIEGQVREKGCAKKDRQKGCKMKVMGQKKKGNGHKKTGKGL